MDDIPDQVLVPTTAKEADDTVYFYMTVHFVVIYRNPNGHPGVESGGAKHINMIVPRVKDTVPMLMIHEAQQAAAMQMVALGLPLDHIMDITFTGVTRMGQMTHAEFMEGVAANVLVSTDEVQERLAQEAQEGATKQ